MCEVINDVCIDVENSVRQRLERNERRSYAASSFCRKLAPVFKIFFAVTTASQLICEGRFTWKELRSQAAKYFVGHWQNIYFDY